MKKERAIRLFLSFAGLMSTVVFLWRPTIISIQSIERKNRQTGDYREENYNE